MDIGTDQHWDLCSVKPSDGTECYQGNIRVKGKGIDIGGDIRVKGKGIDIPGGTKIMLG